MLTGEDSSDATTTKLEDGSTVVPQSNISNTFLLASPSDFDTSGAAVYEISSISSDGIVIQADPDIEEVDRLSVVCPVSRSFSLFSVL